MLVAMKDMSKNIDLILDGKRNNHKFLSNAQDEITKLNDPQKYRPKEISYARLKGYWEKKRKHKIVGSDRRVTCY
ncbi:hypothetical protein IEQ34_026730 [Dendrobium chrysotoxum]|uniref:Uncharacterized protein n=1 Tax=Dendrobium chrysotoxum TaxID=161865 RepID=A0AAV7FKW1_DENCH|nr:hypothetical protein IEQ34_026730 [Dendrobium chrysotoxum]